MADDSRRPTTRAQKVANVGGGVGWVGLATLAVDKVWAHFHPSTVQVLADQYSENLRVIAAGCLQ